MAAVRHIASDNAGVAVAASADGYCPVATGPVVMTTTEAEGTITYDQAGTISNLRVYVVSGNRSSGSPGLWLRKNGSDTAMTVAFAPGGSPISVPAALEDTSNSISVAAGDTLSWHMYGGASGNANWTITLIEFDFTASDDSAITHLCMVGASLAMGNATFYFNPAGSIANNTTQANGEALLKIPSGHSVDVIELETYVTSSGVSVTATADINGLNGSGTSPGTSYSAAETGRKISTSTKSVADADQLSVKVVISSGIGGKRFVILHTTLRSTTGLSFLISGNPAGTSWGTNNHSTALGGKNVNNATETRSGALLRRVRTLSLASVYVSAGNGSGTFTLRDDGADTSLAVATATTAPGWTTDTTHTVTSDATSLYDWRFTRTNTPTVHCIVVAVAYTVTTVTPDTKALSLSTFAPNVTGGGGGVTATPDTKALTTTGYAPTVSTPRLVTPDALALSLSAFAPSVLTPRLVTPDVLALALSTFAPDVTVESVGVFTPGTLALSLTPFAPTVLAPRLVTPDAVALVLATFAPTIELPVVCTPETLDMDVHGYMPDALTPTTVTPDVLALVLTGYEPTIAEPILVTPSTLALLLTPFAPTVLVPRLVTPGVASLILTGLAPVIVHGTVTYPAAGALVLTGFAPDVSWTYNATALLHLSIVAPGVLLSSAVAQDIGLLTATPGAPAATSVAGLALDDDGLSVTLATIGPVVRLAHSGDES